MLNIPASATNIPSAASNVPSSVTSIPSSRPAILQNATAYWSFDDSDLGTALSDSTGRGNNLVRHMLPGPSTLTFAIAANETGAQPTTGELAKWGIWNRVLTGAEITALATGIGWPFVGGNASLADAKAYFLLNEASASASYADATGRGNTLIKQGVGGTVQVAGPQGTDFATQFNGANWLARAATADLAPGNTSHTIAGWVKLDALGTTQQVFWGQFDNGSRTGDVVYYHETYGWINWDFGNDTDLFRNAVTMASNFGHPTTATWYFTVCTYDQTASGNVMSQNVNGSTFNTLVNIQQPYRDAAIVSGGFSGHFQVNPNGNSLQLSGWDQVGNAGWAGLAANADLQIGNNAKTVGFWIKMDDTSTTQTVMGFFDTPTNKIDWVFQVGGNTIAFLLGDSTTHFDAVSVALADTAKHLVVAWFDKLGDGKIHIDIDHGAHVASATSTHTPASNTLNFMMGAATNSGGTSGFLQQLKGSIDECFIANGVPTQADLDALWNGGNGRHY